MQGTYEEQTAASREAAEQLTKIIKAGNKLVVTHGNGPQVGGGGGSIFLAR